jgi:tetratricopeptide repeat protein
MLASMGWMASTYRNQGRWTEAEKLFVQVLETEKTVLGPGHSDTLISMSHLATTYLLESGTMGGGGKAAGASDGDKDSTRA